MEFFTALTVLSRTSYRRTLLQSPYGFALRRRNGV
jgi:hypothetical protein